MDLEVCTQYGIAATADEAWEANGGGKFSFKIDRSGASAGMLACLHVGPAAALPPLAC